MRDYNINKSFVRSYFKLRRYYLLLFYSILF